MQRAKRRPHSRTHGRPGTPVEVALRMLVLERLRDWSFAETEREVRASLLYRKLVRVYFEKVPDAKTLVRLSAVIGSEGVEAIHHRLLEIARTQKLIAGRRARVDTTVVETDIRYPTDSRLWANGVRVLGRALKRIEEATEVVGAQLRERRRATTHRVLEIARAARSRGQGARQRLERGYRRLLVTVRSTVRDGDRVGAELLCGTRKVLSERGRPMAMGARGSTGMKRWVGWGVVTNNLWS